MFELQVPAQSLYSSERTWRTVWKQWCLLKEQACLKIEMLVILQGNDFNTYINVLALCLQLFSHTQLSTEEQMQQERL